MYCLGLAPVHKSDIKQSWIKISIELFYNLSRLYHMLMIFPSSVKKNFDINKLLKFSEKEELMTKTFVIRPSFKQP